MTRQEFYVKWGIPASFEMRDDLIAALSDEAAAVLSGVNWPLPACPRCGWIYFRNGQGELVTEHPCKLAS